MKIYKNVNDYIKNADVAHKYQLLTMRKTVQSAVPDAIESISYGMPAYSWGGEPLFYFAAMKGHLGLYPTSGPIVALEEELKEFSTSKGCVRVPWKAKVPTELVVKLLEERKKEIIESRTKSARLLYKYLSGSKYPVASFISASAVGFYGDRKSELLTEDSANGSGFLAEVCKVWEEEAEKFSALNIAVSKIRIGIVLSKDGGALPKLDFPIKFGIGAYIGDGKQFVPWIHIDDLCNIFIHLLEKNLHDTYNGCAPDIKTNKEMSETIAMVLHRPFIPFPAPGFILKTVMGEMASMLLMSNNCSSQKIINTGFVFQYPELKEALQNIYEK